MGLTQWGEMNLEKGFNPIHYDDALNLSRILNVEPDIFLNDYARFSAPGYGERIRIIRHACNMTQEEFSDLLGVGRDTLAVWEAELYDQRPRRDFYEKLLEIAAEQNIDIDRLNNKLESFEDDYELFLQGDYGKKIKYIRTAYGVYQGEFAEMIGLASGATISVYESMAEKPWRKTFNRIKFLAEAKGIDLHKLNDDPDYYRDDYSKFMERDSGAKIRYIRLQYGLFTDEFGSLLGCSGNAVCTWEAGKSVMGRQYFGALKELAEAKGINLADLNEDESLYVDDYSEFAVPGCGKKIQTLRYEADLSINKFAELMGVSSVTVSIWESEKDKRGYMRRPGRENFESIKKLANELGVDLNNMDDLIEKHEKYTAFRKAGFGKKIIQIREAYAETQEAFAKRLDVSQATLNGWEKEKLSRGKEAYPPRKRYFVLKELGLKKGVDIDDT